MNIVQATDEMLAAFKTRWDSLTTAVCGYVPAVEWPGLDPMNPEDKTKAWARIAILHNKSSQTGFGDSGSRMHTRTGFVAIQIFTPRDLLIAQQLGIIARNAYEDQPTAGGVWFRDATVNEVGTTASWCQLNVLIEFQYDELK